MASHPDVAYEEEMRSRGWIDFSTMDEEQFDAFLRWLRELGYELAEYIDKDSGLLDTVWVNSKHQERLDRLRGLAREFEKARKRFRSPKGTIARLARECAENLQFNSVHH